MSEDEYALKNIDGASESIRSRNIVERKVLYGLREETNASEDTFNAVKSAFQIGVYGPKGDAKGGRQPLLLGAPEVKFLRGQASEVLSSHPADAKAAGDAAVAVFKKNRKNFAAFRENASMPGGLIGALFGRMVTSDPAANIDAAIHVAHAFTVHAEESESDYFSVVDDLQRDEEDSGAAHIGDMELTAGLFYGYVVIDIPGLVSNLTGARAQEWQGADRTLAASVIEHLVHLIATVSPGAKLGSTAPYAYADLMILEAGSRQPRSLANAYRSPISAQTTEAAEAMRSHLAKLDNAYGQSESRRIMSLEAIEIPGAQQVNLIELSDWAGNVVRTGESV